MTETNCISCNPPSKEIRNIKTCSIEGCNEKHKGRGLCTKHYMSMRKAEVKGGATKYATPKARLTCTCKQCGNEYKPKAVDRTTYCSRQCAFKDIASWKKYGRRNVIKARFSRVWFRVCKTCKVSFATNIPVKMCCCLECSHIENLKRLREEYVPIVKTDRMCKSCGCTYSPISRSAYCSKKCAPKRSCAKDRAKNAGVAYEPINPLRVFERDGWKCQICGKKTPRERRGSIRTNAPELDHRQPLSKGGPHTYANVQCACRKCNGDKSNKSSVGQISFEFI